MSSFKVLLKHEFKMQFKYKKNNKKFDLLGTALSLIITLLIAFVFIYLLKNIVFGYSQIHINKILNKIERSRELLCLIYLIFTVCLSFLCIEKMRVVITEKKYKEIFLRLPVKQESLFLSKLIVLLIWVYTVSFIFILPINVLFYLAIKPAFVFFIKTLFIWLTLPLISFFMSTIFLIPYIKVIDFIKKNNVLVFISLSVILILGFLLYSKILDLVQQLLQTGNIKFIFNENFTSFLQKVLKYAYPINCFASVMMGKNLVNSILIIFVFVVFSVFVTYFVSKKLYYITLYKTENRKTVKEKDNKYKLNSQMLSLVKKEFITIFRDSKYVFSYFAVAASMPIMTLCCYKLFETLIQNMLGISVSLKVTFSLALILILIFSVLTNTFCSTNVTRDGKALLHVKSYPLKTSKIMISKVILCFSVSSLAILVSGVLLIATTSLSILNGIYSMILGIMFSLSQIFLSTRMDLNHACLSDVSLEVERKSNQTIAKVISLGIVLSMIIGFVSLFISIFARTKSMNISIVFAYIIPLIISVVYLLLSSLYFFKNLDDKFYNLVE